MMLLKVMFSFIKVCMLSFGGGYSAIPLVANEIVDVQKWMTYAEYADLLALDELTPGPIMINCATFVGMKVAGLPGAMKCMSLALVTTTVIQLGINILFPAGTVALASLDIFSLVLFVLAFIFVRKDIVNPILVLLGCGVLRLAGNLLFGF